MSNNQLPQSSTGKNNPYEMHMNTGPESNAETTIKLQAEATAEIMRREPAKPSYLRDD